MSGLLIGDSAFRTFYAVMLIGTALFDLMAIAILTGIIQGEPLVTPVILVFGGICLIVLIPIAGLALLVPSALTFMTTVKQLEHRFGRHRAIQLAAILTTALASGLFALVASGFGRNFDNIGIPISAISLLGMFWAPRIALWAHDKRAAA
ncbi:hypothetical protein RM190_23075 [Paracoccus sp. CPCC 101403]|uniref:Uncharacterized protein n=1 Tax=Paracoccus broussonetiae TaxID=3075834 RepID=A0ABU3EKH6_9RHOB|nr:hypothetical protein [Paracoccus sp. CPCC 101403]MDT1064757.1 hypothetical protein [Paracoccus sp. CPCC 101403]